MATKSRFHSMLDRLAIGTGFQKFGAFPLKEGIRKEFERKYKNYPRFKRMLGRLWKGYTKNQVAKLIADHADEIFKTWFGKMFYFDVERLEIKEPNTRSDVDFNAKFQYLFSKEDVAYIEMLIKKHDLKLVQPVVVMNQLVLTGLRALGPIVEEFFNRPYDFQPEGVEGEDTDGGRLVKIFFSSREA